MRLVTAAATDVGRVRSENQDAVFASDWLAVVADGMGGHRGGEVASSITVAEFEAVGRVPTVDHLVDLAQRANRQVFERSLGEPVLAGMGTTLCAVAAVEGDGRVAIVNVGDSRAYLLDDSGLRRLSEDHSFVETLVREGRLTPEQAEVHPQRNVLTRALGIEPFVAVDAWLVECGDGDRFLLCSDGLFNEVAEEDIEAVLRAEAAPQDAVRDLVDRACDGGGHDNVSCIVVDVVDVGRTVDPAARQVRRLVPDGAQDGENGEDADVAVGSTVPPASTVADAGASGGEPGAPRPRLTWRVGLVALAVLAVFAVAAGAVAWYGRSTYWVGVRDGMVTRFRGDPEGVLWIHPKTTATGIRLDEVRSEKDRTDLCTGIQFDDQAEVMTYVARLEAERVPAQDGVDCDTPVAPTVAATTTTDSTTTTTAATTSTLSSTAAPVTTAAAPTTAP